MGVLNEKRCKIITMSANSQPIDWSRLSANPSAMSVLETKQDKINWALMLAQCSANRNIGNNNGNIANNNGNIANNNGNIANNNDNIGNRQHREQ